MALHPLAVEMTGELTCVGATTDNRENSMVTKSTYKEFQESTGVVGLAWQHTKLLYVFVNSLSLNLPHCKAEN